MAPLAVASLTKSSLAPEWVTIFSKAHLLNLARKFPQIFRFFDFWNFFSRKRQRKQSLKKGEPCEYDLCSTLDDLYNGKKKKMKIARRRLQPDGSYKDESTVLTIDIKKGWKEGTKITFHNEGNESPGYSAGDIIFKIKVS